MLNWEMELKKWCPAFKILTYYGSQKERKQKRTGNCLSISILSNNDSNKNNNLWTFPFEEEQVIVVASLPTGKESNLWHYKPVKIFNELIGFNVMTYICKERYHVILVYTGMCELASELCVNGFHFHKNVYNINLFFDCLCGLVVRVPGYRSRVLGSIPGTTRCS
jgi:hypothetical protein